MGALEKEANLARKYLRGECNDVQMNYIIQTERMDRDRVDQMIEKMSYVDPAATFVKLMLAYMMIHFLFCLVYSLYQANL